MNFPADRAFPIHNKIKGKRAAERWMLESYSKYISEDGSLDTTTMVNDCSKQLFGELPGYEEWDVAIEIEAELKSAGIVKCSDCEKSKYQMQQIDIDGGDIPKELESEILSSRPLTKEERSKAAVERLERATAELEAAMAEVKAIMNEPDDGSIEQTANSVVQIPPTIPYQSEREDVSIAASFSSPTEYIPPPPPQLPPRPNLPFFDSGFSGKNTQ